MTKEHVMSMGNGAPQLSLETLRAEIVTGEIDTVIVAFTDMQGRLQGKRLHGQFFLDHVLGHAPRAATTCSPSMSR